MSCSYPGCTKPAPLKCSRCGDVRYCSKEHQHADWKAHKKICVPAPSSNDKKKSTPQASSSALVPVKASQAMVDDHAVSSMRCIVCLESAVEAKLSPCGHSTTCLACAQDLRDKEPCLLCRKPIVRVDRTRWQQSTLMSKTGFWATGMKILTHFAAEEGFSDYFQKLFAGNEETYLKWKEEFDRLEIGTGENGVESISLEQQVLRITRSEDLVKLKALAKLSSPDWANDSLLYVAASRRTLEVLELSAAASSGGAEVKGKGKGKKKQKKKKGDLKVLEILGLYFELGVACIQVRDTDEGRNYFKRAKEGYSEQLGRDDVKTLHAELLLTNCTFRSNVDATTKLGDLSKRLVGTLGEENHVTLHALSELAVYLKRNGEFFEARKTQERCLAGRVKTLGEYHRDTLMTIANVGNICVDECQFEKALEYYERAMRGFERTVGTGHPDTLRATMTAGMVLRDGLQRFKKSEEMYLKALDGYEALYGKNHNQTYRCAVGLRNVYKVWGTNKNEGGWEALKKRYRGIENERSDVPGAA
ncbi:hypothetical protein TrST_g3903 [Triparma strigata]|uniref:Uncharacterized protein n=1 Tax=Triparma strigata TaxID=1606541 RepID=A0A9W7E945_9STRA|nr:hypothetical protein TrST_g3903 [Triparma strigata]